MSTTSNHKIFPHGQPAPFAPGLWQVRGTLPFPLTRKMVIHKLGDGTLLLHSVVAMDEDGMKALEALGRPSVMVVPHPMHTMDAPFYAARYPDMKIVATKNVTDALRGKTKVHATPDEIFGSLDIEHLTVPGMKYDELALNVPLRDGNGGRALLFTDLVGQGLQRGFLLKLVGPPGGSGVARIVKMRQMADKAMVRAYLRRAAETPKLAVVMAAHSEPVTDRAKDFLEHAAAGI